ncbi:MAG: LON peptidase substrate-binding domain-containing protein [Polyangia bacterium]
MRNVDLSHLLVFPLPNALLFPHAVLPLHVFELRYRQLLEDALASGKTMAVACLDDERDSGDGQPPLRPLVGIGTIVAHETLPDGRSNMLLRGLGRARIIEELAAPEGRLYRVVRAQWEPDVAIEHDADEAARQTLMALSSQLAAKLPEGGDTLRVLSCSQPDAGALSNLLAAALVTEPSERLRMFETPEILTRADGVAEAIGLALATLSGDRSDAN